MIICYLIFIAITLGCLLGWIWVWVVGVGFAFWVLPSVWVYAGWLDWGVIVLALQLCCYGFYLFILCLICVLLLLCDYRLSGFVCSAELVWGVLLVVCDLLFVFRFWLSLGFECLLF